MHGLPNESFFIILTKYLIIKFCEEVQMPQSRLEWLFNIYFLSWQSDIGVLSRLLVQSVESGKC